MPLREGSADGRAGRGRNGTWTGSAWHTESLEAEPSDNVLKQVADSALEDSGLHSCMLQAAQTVHEAASTIQREWRRHVSRQTQQADPSFCEAHKWPDDEVEVASATVVASGRSSVSPKGEDGPSVSSSLNAAGHLHPNDHEEETHLKRSMADPQAGCEIGERVPCSSNPKNAAEHQDMARGTSISPKQQRSRGGARVARGGETSRDVEHGVLPFARTLFEVLRRTDSRTAAFSAHRRSSMPVPRVEVALLSEGRGERGNTDWHWGAVLRLMENQRVREFLFQQGLLSSPIARPISPGRREQTVSDSGKSLTAPPQRMGPYKNAAGIFVGPATPTRDISIPWGKRTQSQDSRYYNYSSLNDCLGLAPEGFPEEFIQATEAPKSRPMRRRKAKSAAVQQRERQAVSRLSTPQPRQFRQRSGSFNPRYGSYNGWMPASSSPISKLSAETPNSARSNLLQDNTMQRPKTSPHLRNPQRFARANIRSDGVSDRLDLVKKPNVLPNNMGSLPRGRRRPQSHPVIPNPHSSMPEVRAFAASAQEQRRPFTASPRHARSHASCVNSRPVAPFVQKNQRSETAMQATGTFDECAWEGFAPNSARRREGALTGGSLGPPTENSREVASTTQAMVPQPPKGSLKTFDFQELGNDQGLPSPRACRVTSSSREAGGSRLSAPHPQRASVDTGKACRKGLDISGFKIHAQRRNTPYGQ